MSTFRFIAVVVPCALAFGVFVWLVLRLLRGDFRQPP